MHAQPVAAKLAEEFPSNVEYSSKLVTLLHELAQTLYAQNRWDDAECPARQAVAVARRLHETSPAGAHYLIQLALSHQLLAMILLETYRAGPAAEEARKAIALLEKMPDETLASMEEIGVLDIRFKANRELAKDLGTLGQRQSAVEPA